MSKVAVIGAGYVGLTTAACLADLGNAVTVVDINREKIAQLKNHRVPFYEPGLSELVDRNAKAGRLQFTNDYDDAIPGAEYAIIAVSTPEGEGGEADLSYVEAAASSIADHMDGPLVVVNKSTVPPLTGDMVAKVLNKRNGKHQASVVSNPEFLREGSAIQDFMHPDRVVVGSHDRKAAEKVAELYAPLEAPVLITPNIYTAEMVKYASNAFLATRISFINEIARISERVGADAKLVAEGMGLDKRIGSTYLDAGIGYGGSCLVGEETVLIKLRGQVRLTPLSEVFLDFDKSGDMEVQAWRRDSGEVQFLPISDATLRPFEGEVLEIRTKMGRRVVCTPDHPFVTRAGTKLAEQLTTDDWLPLALQPKRQPDSALTEFRLLDGLAFAGLERAQVIVRPALQVLAAVRAAELRPTLTVARSHDVLRAGAMRLPEMDALGFVLEGCVLKTTRNGTCVPIKIEATADFWRLVGLYIAEGHVNSDGLRQRIQRSFNHHGEDDLVEEVRGFWERHGVKADVRHGLTSTHVTVSSRILAGFWRGVLRLGRNCNDARLPDQIWDQPVEHKRALLSGYWMGDGSWSYVRRGPSVILECGTTSRDLADGLVRLLGQIGVVASVRVGRTAKSTRDTYWIRCSGADQVEKLLDLVPERDREAIQSSIRRQKKRIAPTGYRRDGDGTAWVRVVDIKRRPFSGAVYSLEVPGAHTFVTTAGLVTHNCFPKDVAALAALAQRFDYHPEMLHAVMDINRDQRMLVIDKLRDCLDTLNGRTIGLLGLAFKPNTDDLREAPSLDIAKVLLAAGSRVRAYDPAAMERTRQILPDVEYLNDAYEVAAGADAVVIVTEWNEFRHLDLARLKDSMSKPILIDGRNIYDPEVMRELGFTYRGIGRE
ncbi:MAG TPA: nucleotide sugar dehydrogenase [Candidatus Dormibacteraeota bacterium]|nr:nucleotide sugar dehydrogenase [Candidatus Dormibacteraeota bacterium]